MSQSVLYPYIYCLTRHRTTNKIKLTESDKNRYRTDRQICILRTFVSIKILAEKISYFYAVRRVHDYYLLETKRVEDKDFVTALTKAVISFGREYYVEMYDDSKLVTFSEKVYVSCGTAHILRVSDPRPDIEIDEHNTFSEPEIEDVGEVDSNSDEDNMRSSLLSSSFEILRRSNGKRKAETDVADTLARFSIMYVPPKKQSKRKE